MSTREYLVCLEYLAVLEKHARNHAPLCDAVEPWCALCDAAGTALNEAIEACV